MFQECLSACVGMPTLIDRTVQPGVLPFDGIILAIQSAQNVWAVLTPVVMILGATILECSIAMRARKGHFKSR